MKTAKILKTILRWTVGMPLVACLYLAAMLSAAALLAAVYPVALAFNDEAGVGKFAHTVFVDFTKLVLDAVFGR